MGDECSNIRKPCSKNRGPPKTQESGWRVFKNPSLYIYIYMCVCLCVCVCLPWVMSVQISESPVQKNYAACVFGVDHCLLTKKRETREWAMEYLWWLTNIVLELSSDIGVCVCEWHQHVRDGGLLWGAQVSLNNSDIPSLAWLLLGDEWPSQFTEWTLMWRAVQGWDDDCNTCVFVCVHICVCVSMRVFVWDGYFDDAQWWW